MNDRLQEPINITPPSKNSFGKYQIQIFFETTEKWYEIEMLITALI